MEVIGEELSLMLDMAIFEYSPERKDHPRLYWLGKK